MHIDVEIDVSTPEGQKLFDTAVRGRFSEVFDPVNAKFLRVHHGVPADHDGDAGRQGNAGQGGQ